MSQLSDKKDQVVDQAKGAIGSFSATAQNKLDAEKGRISAAIAKHPKTLIVIAFLVGAILGLVLGSAGSAPASAGATAPHSAYNASPRSEWHEFVPFKDGGARGNG